MIMDGHHDDERMVDEALEGTIRLLEHVVPPLVETEDPSVLQEMLGEPGVVEAMTGQILLSEEDRRRLVFWLARLLWNAFPLPSQGFRPHPLPRPRPNEPCPCGSGVKHKRCCRPFLAEAETVTRTMTDAIWLALAPALPAGRLTEALRRRRLDPEMAAAAAQRLWTVHERPRKAAALAETVVEAVGLDDPRVELALDLLWDLYGDLGWSAKKERLLQQAMAAGAPRVRAAAHQRMATIAADQGRFEAAWEHHEQARRLAPDHPALGLLEVTLLVSQKRLDDAADRARYWLRRLERDGGLDEGMRAFLETVARDPGGMRLAVLAEDDPLRRLDALLREAAGRARAWPLLAPPGPPEEADGSTGGDEAEELRAVLESMGLEMPEGLDLEGTLEGMEDLEEKLAAEEARALAAHYPDREPPPERVLAEPETVAACVREWRQVFPAPKPFGTAREPFSGTDEIWRPDLAARWLAWLERHPEALDSLDVLDDLALAVEAHPMGPRVGVPESVYDPLLERAAEAVEHALRSHEGPARLPWGWHENRPALRLLMRLAERRREQDRREETRAIYRRLLELDPLDGLGARLPLMNEHLREGEDAEALALAGCYADDMMVETRFGEALALWRLGRLDEARAALARAHAESNRHVIPMLCARRRRRPRELDEPFGVTLGGRSQAWLYSEDMADVWQATPGILDAAREIAGRSGSR